MLTHTLQRPSGLLEVPLVVDVGAGLRPMQWYRPARHLCVEPFAPYADALRLEGYMVVQETAEVGLAGLKADAVYLLDVIEHMEKDEGARVLQLAVEVASKQVVVFTPYGFIEQTKDAWGMGGEKWQTHRSGWTPSDFPGWRTELVQTWGAPPAFFAVWTHK